MLNGLRLWGRLGAAAGLALALVAPSEARSATRMVHENGWAVTAPKGWDPYQGEAAMGADFRMFGPRDRFASCAFDSRTNLGLDMTNAQIKATIGAVSLGSEVLSRFLLSSDLTPGELSDAVFSEPTPQPDHASGWPVQRAEFTYYDGGTKAAGGTASKGWAIITFKNDTVFVGYCGVDTETASSVAADVNAIFNSIELTR